MASKKKSKLYISKGERPNVNQKILNSMRRERVPSTISLLKKRDKRTQIILRPQDKKEKELRVKYMKEDSTFQEANRLYGYYGKCGLTWGAAIQAVKTEYVEKLREKWNPKLKAWIRDQKKKSPMELRAHFIS